jgi:hypothetical protein
MISKFSLVYEILNLIRPLTLDMNRRLHETPSFPAEKISFVDVTRFPRRHAR